MSMIPCEMIHQSIILNGVGFQLLVWVWLVYSTSELLVTTYEFRNPYPKKKKKIRYENEWPGDRCAVSMVSLIWYDDNYFFLHTIDLVDRIWSDFIPRTTNIKQLTPSDPQINGLNWAFFFILPVPAPFHRMETTERPKNWQDLSAVSKTPQKDLKVVETRQDKRNRKFKFEQISRRSTESPL